MKDETNAGQEAPLACNLYAFNPEQQKQYGELTGRLNASMQEVRDLPDGCAFQFPSEVAVCQEVMEFATGSTVSECAWVLRNAGAKRIAVLALVRGL